MSLVEPLPAPTAALLPKPVSLRRDFVMPLAAIGLLVIIAMTLAVHFGVKALNRESEMREQQLVMNGLELRMNEVSDLVVPQVDWDDAVRNLDNSFDVKWARDNIHEFLEMTYGFDAEFVLDGNDTPVYGAIDGNEFAREAFAGFATASRVLMTSVRNKEKARGPLVGSGGKEVISQKKQSSAIRMVNGKLTILTATLVQPDFGTAMPSGARAPIVLTGMYIDEPFLETFSRRFLLDTVTVRLPSQPALPDRVEVPVRNETGKVEAYLTWKPLEPGYGMLRGMGLPVLQGLIVIIAIAAFQLRRIFGAAQKLIEREQFSYAFAFSPR